MSDIDLPSLDTAIVTASLDALGFAKPVVDRYRKLERDAHRALDEAGAPREGRRAWIAPGRIEVLGKHVDYAGGRSLLCAVERGIVVVTAPRTDRKVVLRDARRREALVIALDPSPYPATQAPLPWSVYPRTVIRRLQRNFDNQLVGADIALASNLPPAAGVSSSSALMVGLTLALSAMGGLHQHPLWQECFRHRTALAGYIGAMENGLDFGVLTGERGVGTLGGAQDQTAILCCAPGQLDVFGWAPVRHERSVAWPDDHVFVILVSGVVAAKTGAAKERYNRVARTAHHIVHAWNAQGGTARTLADAYAEAAGATEVQGVPDALLRAAVESATDEFTATQLTARLTQFYDEAWRHVAPAADAIAHRDFALFGEIVAASQRGAERALANQIPETMQLVVMARELGAVAASAFGAGFGGSVWAMIPSSDADRFMSRWRERYVKQFPHVAHRVQVFQTRPSAPAIELRVD
ncbi:MAG: galactokinase [Gemmatimonadaceae bacterium]|nr:galactokinase [Gemmatimonadaceae bacterium]